MSIKSKWLKKLLSAALCVTMLGGTAVTLPAVVQDSALTVSAASLSEVPEGYTAVTNIEELYAIRSNPSGNYILMNDIDLSATAPGGDWDCGTGWDTILTFSGILDGNGHTISNIYLQDSTKKTVAFIKDNKGTVKNLTVTKMHRNSSFFIRNNAGTIENITVIDDEKDNYKTAFVETNSKTISNVHISENSTLNDYSCAILCDTNYSNISYCSAKGTSGGCLVKLLSRSLSNSFVDLPGGCLVYESIGSYDYKSFSCYKYNGKYYNYKYNYYCEYITEGYYPNLNDWFGIYNCYAKDTSYFVYNLGGKIYTSCNFGSDTYYKLISKSPKSISLENGSTELNYTYYKFSDFKYGFYKTQSGDTDSYSKLDFEKVWEIAPDGSRPQLIDNREITVTKIDVTKLPPKTVYTQGEDIVPIGEITVTCSNGKTAKANIEKSMLTYDMSKVGKQQVKVSYKGGEGYFEITVNPIKATGITLNQSEIHMNKGETYSKLKATIAPDNATDKTVTWSSSDPTIATIDENGIITAVDKGTVTIIAKTENEKAAACTVYIANPASSIALENRDMHVGAKKKLKPVITPADTTSTLKWSSSNPSVASVDQNGVVTAVAPGQAEIKVETSDGPYATSLITVDAPTKAIVPAVKTKDMFVGKTYTLNVTVTPDYTTDIIFCSSDNSSVASAVPVYKTVQVYDAQKDTYNEESRFAGCKITANAPGEATVNITSANGKTVSCKVTVKQPVESISLDYSNMTIELGETDKLTAMISPSEHDETIKWTSSHDEIVSVDQEGNLTTHATGVATIKVRSSGGKYATCKVTVTKTANDMQLSQTNLAVEKGKTKTVTCTLTPADATDKVSWTSSNESVATVRNGKITGVSAGTAQITATTTGGLLAVVNVTVKVFAKSISLNKDNIELAKGTSQTLNVTFDPDDTTNKTITWTTSNSKVATVKNGKVIAVGAGTATITAKSANGKTASCEVRVYIVPNKVVLNKTSFTMNNGTQTALTATVYPSASENKTITWRSSNESIAAVDSNGKVTAKSSGTATITAATFNGISASCTVTVVTKPSSISLNQTTLLLKTGGGTGISATVLPTTADNKTVTWTSSNTSVATVTGGYIRGNKAGTATITATTVNGLKASCTVTVKDPDVLPTAVAISKTSLSLTTGNTATLTATVSPSNATNKSVGWTSSNTTVATVKDGVVTAKSAGTATITVKTYNGKTASCTVTVTNPVVNPTSVSLNKTSLSLTVGNTATLTATVSPTNATNKTVTWTTSNSSVATVSNGKVTAKGAGTATITAKTSNGKTAACTVTVTKPVETQAQKNFRKVSDYIKKNYDDTTSGGVPYIVTKSGDLQVLIAYFSSDDTIVIVGVYNPSSGLGEVTIKIPYSSIGKAYVSVSETIGSGYYSVTNTASATIKASSFTMDSSISYSADYTCTDYSRNETINQLVQIVLMNSSIELLTKGLDISYLGFTSYY